MCVGVLPAERVTRARASGTGEPRSSSTARPPGRDGIGGASVLASQELSDEDEDKRPTVQIGDPFTGKKLIEASLELVERGLVESLQDLGAAGLASSLAEMAGRGERRRGRPPRPRAAPRGRTSSRVEVMISESQERMVAVVDARAPRATSRRSAAAGSSRARRSGRSPTRASCGRSGTASAVGAIPARLLTDEAPRYRVETHPRSSPRPIEHREAPADADALLALLASPNVRSRRRVFERYDHLVGSRTVRRPGLDAAVLRLRPSLRGLAVSLDGSGPRRLARPADRRNAASVLEAARNVACAGGRPLAITNCLNFGNPEKAGGGVGAHRGDRRDGGGLRGARHPRRLRQRLPLQRDRRARDPPHPGGRVRRRGRRRALGPGRLARGRRRARSRASRALALDGSEYQARFLGGAGGRPPRPRTRRRGRARRLPCARRPRSLTRAHDGSEGGLAVALAELALWSRRRRRGRDRRRRRRAGSARAAGRRSSRAGPRTSRACSRACRFARSARSAATGCCGVSLDEPAIGARGRRRLMCGVLGIRAPERDVARLAYFGLFALQHRGQESAGIAVSDDGRAHRPPRHGPRDAGLLGGQAPGAPRPARRSRTAATRRPAPSAGRTRSRSSSTASARTVALGHNGNLMNTTRAARGARPSGRQAAARPRTPR